MHTHTAQCDIHQFISVQSAHAASERTNERKNDGDGATLAARTYKRAYTLHGRRAQNALRAVRFIAQLSFQPGGNGDRLGAR